MQALTEEINQNRAERAAEADDNTKIRKLIGDKIEAYKKEEKLYQQASEAY